MTNNNKTNSKTYFNAFNKSAAIGAEKGFTVNCQNLHTLVSAISAEEGIRKQIHNVRINIRASIEDSQNVSLQPVVVQTAGTWTDNVATTMRQIDTLLGASIDDKFGYDCLGNLRTSKPVATGDGTLATMVNTIITTVNLPQKLIQILNKEAESERLQDLLFGFVGVSSDTGLSLYIIYTIEIQFTELRQKVVIR